MYIDIVPNRKSAPAVLLRESCREGGKIVKRTIANLTGLPMQQVEQIRRTLKGEVLAPVESMFEIRSSRQHGNVAAVLSTMQRLQLGPLLEARSSRERKLVMAMVAARVLEPQSKLATTRWWETTDLPQQLGIEDATEEDLYAAMDWLGERQERIEARLAKRHLREGGTALYDLSSTYFEGETCPLAQRGYSRDGKPGSLQVNFGLLTDNDGRPVAVSVFPGNTGDPSTVTAVLEKLRGSFALKQVVLVGDRGMITQRQISELRSLDGMDWVTAVRPEVIRKLLRDGQLQLGLFDDRNLFETHHPDYPGERLVACKNHELAKHRAYKRESLLCATIENLEAVQKSIREGRLRGKDKIGVRVGRVLNKHKVAKHFIIDIQEESLLFKKNEDSIRQEASLDGIYVIRTSLKEAQMGSAQTVLTYKRLAEVEKAFRSMKSIDLEVRPIHHRLETRVRAHIFLCVLAYYVKWHMFEAWRSLLFADEDVEARRHRDPVLPSTRSETAEAKVSSKRTTGADFIAHSFRTLLQQLGSIVRNRCVIRGKPDAQEFIVDTQPTPLQQKALELLREIPL